MEFLPIHYSPESLWLQGMNKVNEYKGHRVLEGAAKVAARVMALALPAVASIGLVYHLCGAIGKAALMLAPKETLEKYNLTEFTEGADLKTVAWQALAFKATAFVTTVLGVVGVFSPEKAVTLATLTGLYATDMSPIKAKQALQEMAKNVGAVIIQSLEKTGETSGRAASILQEVRQFISENHTEQSLSDLQRRVKAEVDWENVRLGNYENRYDFLSQYTKKQESDSPPPLPPKPNRTPPPIPTVHLYIGEELDFSFVPEEIAKDKKQGRIYRSNLAYDAVRNNYLKLLKLANA